MINRRMADKYYPGANRRGIATKHYPSSSDSFSPLSFGAGLVVGNSFDSSSSYDSNSSSDFSGGGGSFGGGGASGDY